MLLIFYRVVQNVQMIGRFAERRKGMNKEKTDALSDALTELVHNYFEKDIVLHMVKGELFDSESIARAYCANISHEELIKGYAFFLRQLIELQMATDISFDFTKDLLDMVLDAIDFNGLAEKYLKDAM